MTTSPIARVPGVRRIGTGSAWARPVAVAAAVAGIAVLLVLFVLPAAMLVVGAFRDAPPTQEGSWSLTGLIQTYTSPATYLVAANSIILAVSTSLLSTGIAVFFAWVATRTTTPLRRLITPLMFLGLLMPQLYFGLAWVMLGNPQNGTLNLLARAVLGPEATPFDVNSWAGLIVLTSLSFAPVCYVLLVGVFVRMDGSMEEAARISGAGWARTLFGTTLPALTPAIAGVLILQITGVFAAFELPLLLGTPARIGVFSTAVYTSVYISTPARYDQASALSLLLMVMVLIAVIVYQRVVGGRTFTTITGKSFRPQPVDYGPVQWLFTVLFLGFALVTLVLPVGELVLGSFQPIFGVYQNLTWNNYAEVFADDATMNAIATTALVGVGGGFVAMLLATIVSYLAARRGPAVRRFKDVITWIPWAIPGIVLGLGILWAYLSVPFLRSLYGTVWLLLIGLVVCTVPVAARSSDGALATISVDLEESARVAGAGPTRVFLSIVARLVAPSFLAGWAISAVFIAGNLSLPILLSSPSTQTVATLSYNLYAGGDSAVAAALFCVLGAGLVLGYLVWLLGRAIARRRRTARGLRS